MRVALAYWYDEHAQSLLCWHGVGFTSSASLTFAELAPLLVEHGFRILALDAPGYGSSPALPRAAYHPHALADLVPQVLAACDVDRPIFMGFSWGGDVGCHTVARHAEKLSGLVLLDAGYSDPPFDPSLPYATYLELNKQRAARQRTTVDPRVVAAIELGMAQAPPSATRGAIAVSRLPVLLIAARSAPQGDVNRFVRDIPQARVVHAKGLAHNVLADGGQFVVQALTE